ncbi:MAG: hypothetical protein E6H05_10230 [Bacillati bacterium ANGP1]|uniref:Uncharacterized protein n=1 Tax=Candidatus Segetimicrobium genomatis TaxID=2569760 RepID=A0A537IP39_9BACT|nr:MAG: hypothetical protein E6H05_10230 [Terrabacteria group bacterium ANGP1]
MLRKVAYGVIGAGVIAALGVFIYLAGWHAGAALHQTMQGAAAAQPAAVSAIPAQNLPVQPEIIPFPGPDRQGPGQGQGQGQDCQPIILFYYQGRLYQLMPGPDNPPGMPGSPPEYFPLRPYQGPQIPGLPFGPAPQPFQQPPGFQPVQPRF